jgi:hypothetical protein
VLVLFSVLTSNIFFPVVALAEEISDFQSTNTQVEADIPIDESEDIIEDGGVSTSVFEEDEAYEPRFVFENGIYTVNSVVEGEEYVYPDNRDVRVKFSSVTEEGDLVISKVLLTEEEKELLNTSDDFGWDISSNMDNGSFKYDLTLPNSTESNDVEVKYTEDGEKYNSIDNNVIVNENVIEIKDLDHFTVFIVVETIPGGISEGLDEVNNDCTVKVSGTDIFCYDSIQEAIDHADNGDTINISSGTYTLSSQLVISKDLTILGEDKNNTTIKASFDTGSGGDSRGLILIKDNVTVTISGITINGDGRKVYQAIRANNAEVLNFSDSIIKNISYPNYQGFGVAIMNTDGEMNDIYMENIGRVGAIIFGETANYSITDFIYTGKGNGDWLDYGIEVGGGATASIQNVNISNCKGIASSDGSTSAGVLATTFYEDGTYIVLENSVFQSNSLSLAVGYDENDNTTAFAHYNDFSGDDLAISTTKKTVDATNNKWGTSKEAEIKNLIEGDVLYDPWYGKEVEQSLDVNEYQKDGIYYVKYFDDKNGNPVSNNDFLDLNIVGEPIYHQKYIVGLWGYDETTGSRDSNRYRGWETYYPDSNDLVDVDLSWQTVTDKWMGSNPPGTPIPAGDYILWVERYYEEGGYVPGSTVTKRITIDNQSPTILNTKMFVWRNNNWEEDYLAKSGDEVKVWIEVEDELTEVDKVEIWIREYPWDPNNNELISGYMTEVDPTHFEFVYIVPDTYKNGDPINQSFEGNYFNFRPYDILGNSYIGWRKNFTIDNTSPAEPAEITILDYEGNELGCTGYTNNKRITIDWEPSESSDVAYYRYDIIDQDDKAHFTNTQYTGDIRDSDGYYQYRVWAVDYAGNISDESSGWCGVTLDRVDPTGSIDYIHYPSKDVYSFKTNDSTPIIGGTYEDNNEVVNITIAIGSESHIPQFTNGDWISNEFSELADGKHTAILTITDIAGNTSTFTQEITIDTTPPNAIYTHYNNGVIITDPIAFVKGVNQLSFTAKYDDPYPSSGLYQDSFVIFQAQDDGSFRFSANGKEAYCTWRESPNLVDTLQGRLYELNDPVPFTYCTTSLPDGEYYMAHQVYDSATRQDIPTINQFRDVLGLHFVVDTQAPEVEITSPLNGTNVNGIVDIRGSVEDKNPDHYYLVIKNSTGDTVAGPGTVNRYDSFIDQFLYQWDTTEEDDGQYTISLAARDAAGNRDDTVSLDEINVTVDNTPPTIPVLESPIDGVYIKDNTPLMQWKDSTDDTDVTGYYYRVYYNCTDTNDPSTCLTVYPPNPTGLWRTSSEYQAGTTSDGTYYWQVKAVDVLGNESDWSDLEKVIIDTRAPEPPKLTGDPVQYVKWGNVTRSWLPSSSPDVDYYMYKNITNGWTSGPYNAGLEEYSITHSTGNYDRIFEWRVAAVDYAGNETWSENAYKVVVDNTPPTQPEITNSPNNSYTNVNYITIEWTGGDDEGTNQSGIKGYILGYEFIPANGGSTITWSTGLRDRGNPYTHSGTYGHGQGTYVFYVKTVDNAGNESPVSETFTITYDKTPPTEPINLSFETTEGEVLGCGSITNEYDIVATWDSSTDNSPITYEYRSYNPTTGWIWNGGNIGDVLEREGSFTVGEGVYGFAVRAVDAAGNTSDWTSENISESCQITYDISEPLIEQLEQYTYNLSEGEDIPDVETTVTDETGLKKGYYELTNTDLGTFTDEIDLFGTSETIDTTALIEQYAQDYFSEDITTIDTFYIPEGKYIITYWVEDVAGNVSSTETVTVNISNVIPTIESFTADRVSITEGDTVNFEAVFSDPAYIEYASGKKHADDSPWIYSFNPEGTYEPELSTNIPGEILSFSHTYNNEGTFIAEFMVCEDSLTNGEGQCANETVEITVSNNIPTVEITATDTEVLEGDDLIVLSTTVTNGNSPFTYEWSGNCTGTDAQTTFDPTAEGSYTCTVTVTDVDDDTSTDSVDITVGAVQGVTEQNTEEGEVAGETTTRSNTVYATQTLGTGSGTEITEETETIPEEEVLGEDILTCENPIQVSGYVYLDKNKNDQMDENEKGIAGISITITGIYKENRITIDTVETDEKGYYKTELCPDTYTLTIDRNDLPKNTEIEEVLSLEIKEDTTEPVEYNIPAIDTRNFWQKYWYLILIAGALGITTVYVVTISRKKEQEY